MTLYKYRSFGEFTNKIIINSSLYFASPESFNDPFDCNLDFKKLSTKEEIVEFVHHIMKLNNQSFSPIDIEKIVNSFQDNPLEFQRILDDNLHNRIKSEIGVLSLSANPLSILMWSHYAKNHTGLLFEFSISEQSPCFINIPNSESPILALPVEYVDEYNKLSYSSTDDISKLLLTKYKGWAYEEEYRVTDLKYKGEKEFAKTDLRTIIFALNAKQEDIDYIIKLCTNHGFEHVKFKQAKKVSGKFTLEFHDL